MNILRLRFPPGSAATRGRMAGLPITFLFALSCLPGFGASRTETFKKFTESPPPLRELVYRIQRNEFGTNPVYFGARWQTNAFSLRSASTLDRLRSGILETNSGFNRR